MDDTLKTSKCPQLQQCTIQILGTVSNTFNTVTKDEFSCALDSVLKTYYSWQTMIVLRGKAKSLNNGHSTLLAINALKSGFCIRENYILLHESLNIRSSYQQYIGNCIRENSKDLCRPHPTIVHAHNGKLWYTHCSCNEVRRKKKLCVGVYLCVCIFLYVCM